MQIERGESVKAKWLASMDKFGRGELLIESENESEEQILIHFSGQTKSVFTKGGIDLSLQIHFKDKSSPEDKTAVRIISKERK